MPRRSTAATGAAARSGRAGSNRAWWTGGYLLTVYRYIELNPVRAAMVDTPEAYRWSSVHANLGLREDPAITPHPAFLHLGPDSTMRGAVYRRWLDGPLLPEDVQAIRAHLQQERALGDPRFQAMVEKALNRPARLRAPGRPLSSLAAESA